MDKFDKLHQQEHNFFQLWDIPSVNAPQSLNIHQNTMQVETREGSGVIRVNETTRVIRLAALLPVTRPRNPGDPRDPIHSRVYYIAGSYLAVKHFNARSDTVIGDLSQRLKGCDIQLSIDYRDTQYSRIVSARHLQNMLLQYANHSLETPFPTALIGGGRSDVSESLSILSAPYSLPQVSPHSSASSLDNKQRFPFFARTTPSNEFDGRAAVVYLKHLQVSHVGVVYVLDTNGNAYHSAIQDEAFKQQISVVSAPYRHDYEGEDSTEESMRSAILRIKERKVRYIFAVTEPGTWKRLLRIAVQEGIMGNSEFVWIFHSGGVGLVGEVLDKETESDIALAMHGTGILLKDFPSNPKLDQVLAPLETSSSDQRDFVSHFSEQWIFEDFDFRHPGPNYPQYINYDAVIALGLAACSIEHDFFTGQQLYTALIQTRFPGASDQVSFDNTTGSRDSVPFRVDNIRVVESNTSYSFLRVPTAKLNFQGVQVVEDFIYWSNTTNVPMTLPALKDDLNLISPGILGIGLTLCVASMLTAIGWGLWTCMNRKSAVVRAAQPFFLYQLCLGTCIMASSIIPLSFQDSTTSQQGLNISCMATPWLFVLGYTASFSALFSKTWRVLAISKSASGFRRVQVTVKQSLFPLAILMFLNVSLLVAWTIVDPLKWRRVDGGNFDEFGRSQDSHGGCHVSGSSASVAIPAVLFSINVLALLFVNYQCYKTRNLPIDFNELFYMALTNASLLEAFILAAPILFIVSDSPSAAFFVKSALISTLSMCIMLPLFVSKHLQRKTRGARDVQASVQAMMSSSLRRGSAQNSNHTATNSGLSDSIRRSASMKVRALPNINEQEADAQAPLPQPGLRILSRKP